MCTPRHPPPLSTDGLGDRREGVRGGTIDGMPTSASPVFAGFRARELVSVGVSANVYFGVRAEPADARAPGSLVAIKVCAPQAPPVLLPVPAPDAPPAREASTSRDEECRVLALHPISAMPRLLDVGTTRAGELVIVMSVCAGRPLARLPALGMPAAGFARRLRDLVAELHEAGIAHGGLEADHVLVAADGELSLVGFARAALLNGGVGVTSGTEAADRFHTAAAADRRAVLHLISLAEVRAGGSVLPGSHEAGPGDGTRPLVSERARRERGEQQTGKRRPREEGNPRPGERRLPGASGDIPESESYSAPVLRPKPEWRSERGGRSWVRDDADEGTVGRPKREPSGRGSEPGGRSRAREHAAEPSVSRSASDPPKLASESSGSEPWERGSEPGGWSWAREQVGEEAVSRSEPELCEALAPAWHAALELGRAARRSSRVIVQCLVTSRRRRVLVIGGALVVCAAVAASLAVPSGSAADASRGAPPGSRGATGPSVPPDGGTPAANPGASAPGAVAGSPGEDDVPTAGTGDASPSPVGASDEVGVVDGSSGGTSAEAFGSAMMGDDPVAAARALLERRERCLRERDLSCLSGVDEWASPLAVADRDLIVLANPTIPSGGPPASAGSSGPGSLAPEGQPGVSVDGEQLRLVQRLGALSILSAESGGAPPGETTKPVSLLVVRGETGWRLRWISSGQRADSNAGSS